MTGSQDGSEPSADEDGASPSRGLRTYYALLITESVSLLGSLVSGLVVSISIFRETGQATPLALVEFFSILPVIVTSGFSGALADRFDRRLLMLVANVGFVLCSSLLLLTFASDAFRLWHLYAFSCANGLFAALQRPAFQASVTMLVPDDLRDKANAWGQLTGPAARVIAPAIAGLLFASIGVVGAIALDILTFVAAILVLFMVRIPTPEATEEGRSLGGSIWRQAFDGFRYLLARPALFFLVAHSSLVTFLVFGALVLGTPYVLARTGSETQVGWVLVALTVGAVIGAIVMGAWGGTKPRVHTVFPGWMIAGGFLALAGVAQGAVMLAATFFAFMFARPFIDAAGLSILQMKIAPDVQGRVFAAIGQITSMLAALAFLIAGPLADNVLEPARNLPVWSAVGWAVGTTPGSGMGLLFVVSGALTVLISLAFYLVPAIRRVETALPDYVPAAK